MKILLALSTLALTACAPMQPLPPLPDHWTTEQRIQYLQAMQSYPAPRLPIYENNITIPQLRMNQTPMLCQSNRSGRTTDTICY